ncbi:unnamed protein product, partial [Heterosigma akashiwo]
MEDDPPTAAVPAGVNERPCVDFVRKLIGCEIKTTLSDGRTVVGTFDCLDRLKN